MNNSNKLESGEYKHVHNVLHIVELRKNHYFNKLTDVAKYKIEFAKKSRCRII